jgi:CheY-like chemotaxis protein
MEAIDGEAAVASYKSYSDLILMDIKCLIRMVEAATEIRAIETSSKTPIIAVTAGILIGEKEKCFDSGMDDYMPKPIIIDELGAYYLLGWELILLGLFFFIAFFPLFLFRCFKGSFFVSLHLDFCHGFI